MLVYTDGSCSDNGKQGARGGMGVHFPEADLQDLSVQYQNTSKYSCTNQRTELAAILIALKSTDPTQQLTIKTDSKYCVTCFQNAAGWRANGYKTKDGSAVANLDLVKKLLKLVSNRQVSVEHVPRAENSEADRLARAATERATLEIADPIVKL